MTHKRGRARGIPDKVPPPPRKKGGGSAKQTKYRVEYDKIAANLVRLTGATVTEVAEVLGHAPHTLYRWMADHPSFREAFQISREVANARVEASWYQEAVGYWVTETEKRTLMPTRGKGPPQVVVTEHRKWIRPSPQVLVWWTRVMGGHMLPEEKPPVPELPVDDGGQTIDNVTHETDRQVARRLAFLITKGNLEEEGEAA